MFGCAADSARRSFFPQVPSRPTITGWVKLGLCYIPQLLLAACPCNAILLTWRAVGLACSGIHRQRSCLCGISAARQPRRPEAISSSRVDYAGADYAVLVYTAESVTFARALLRLGGGRAMRGRACLTCMALFTLWFKCRDENNNISVQLLQTVKGKLGGSDEKKKVAASVYFALVNLLCFSCS